MERKNLLTKLFYDVLNSLLKRNKKRFHYDYSSDEIVEAVLENYILNVMGYPVYYEYRSFVENRTSVFEYFGEIRKYFENIINNFSAGQMSLLEWINQYGNNFYNEIHQYPYVEIFIDAVKMNYSSNPYDIVITQRENSYSIYRLNNKNKDDLPMVNIDDIKELDKALKEYVFAVRETDNFYKKALIEEQCMSEENSIKLLLFWTLRNASITDLICIEDFIRKYTNFLYDTSFEHYKNHPVHITSAFDDELYFMCKKATIAYETPYYLRFMLASKRVEFPNIRYGIEEKDGEKSAYILAIQSSQEINPNKNHFEISDKIKKDLPKSKYFREFNPMQLASLVLFVGLLNGQGIKKLSTSDFLAFRYQRYALEERKNEEELCEYQHRLTNKYINTFFRMLEYTDQIKITNYPDDGTDLKLELEDAIYFSSPILQELYEIGFNASKELKDTKEKNYTM